MKHTELGVLAIGRGRYSDADHEFQMAGSFSAPARAAVYARERRRLLRRLPDFPVGELPALPPPAAGDTMQVEPSVSEYAAPDLRDVAEARYGELPAMVDGFLDVAEGHLRDTSELERVQREASPRADSARVLLAAARAALAFRAGQWNTVDRNLDVRLITPLWLPLMPVERYWHAIALETEGRITEAMQWLNSFDAVAPEQRTMEARAPSAGHRRYGAGAYRLPADGGALAECRCRGPADDGTACRAAHPTAGRGTAVTPVEELI